MKKIIAMAMCVLLCMSTLIFVPAYGAQKYENASDFLIMLGILPNEQVNEESTVTRAQFCDILLKSMAADEEGEYENPFDDVNENTEYKSAILKASNMGIVRGDGRNRFNPDAPISFNAAVKMATEALGYEGRAYHSGGFPAGHIIVANEIGLLKGVPKNGNESISYGALAALMYNFLNADICQMKAVSDTEITYEPVKGECPLTEYFHLKKTSGVVKSANYKTMVPDDKADFPRINIDGNIYKTNLSDTEKFLGRDVVMWYDEEGYARAIYENSKNSSVIINAENIDTYGDYTLKTFDKNTGYEEKFNLDKAFTFVKNGRNHIPKTEDFLFSEGKIELIDNTGDRIYDVVLASKTEYMVVTGLGSLDKTVYDNKNGGRNAVFKNEEGYYCDLEIRDKYGVDEKAQFKDITQEMVLELYKSDDGKYVKAIATKNVLSGTVSEIDSEGVVIGGKEYKFNGYFFEKPYITVGKSYNFLLAPNGTITALSSIQEGGLSYGYFFDYFEEEEGLSMNVQIALMTESGEYIHPYLADDIYLDGERVKKEDERVKNALTNGDLPEYQLIKYGLDEDKKISKIDTYKDASASGEDVYGKYSKSFDGDDSLTRFLPPTTSYWYQTFYTFTGHAVLGSSTVMMVVPTSILGGVSEKLSEKAFGVTNGGLLLTSSYQIETYDVGKEMEPGVIILYTENGGGGGGVAFGKDTRTCIVDKFTSGVNEEGENVYFLYMWSDGSFYRYSVQPEDYDRFKAEGNIPMPGDIIRVAVDAKGDVVQMAVDARYDEKSGLPKFTSNVPADGSHAVNCYIGTVFSHSNSRITLLVKPEGISGVNASYSAPIVDGITPFMLRGNERIAIFDTKTKSVRQGKLDMISDALAVGEENATKVYIKAAKHNSSDIYIYE